MARPTIFVIDDEQSVRTALCRLLESVKLGVRCFSSAQEFLAVDPQDHPSCLILDTRLPGLSGLDLQQELLRLRRSIPLIFVTAHGDVRATVRAMKAGALDFFEKPFNDQELLDAISRGLATASVAAVREAERAEVARRVSELTSRERDVLSLVVRGLPNKNIAAQLGIAEKTVKIHRGRMMKKMKADSLAELVRSVAKIESLDASHPGERCSVA